MQRNILRDSERVCQQSNEINMDSITTKRIIRGVVGLLFAFIYGFWTILATGGGHGNYIWFYLFMVAGFYGFYYPIMAALSADLRPTILKVVFGALVIFNLAASSALIIAWVFGLTGKRLDEFNKTYEVIGLGGILFSGVVHFLPTIVFAFQLAMAVVWDASPCDDESAPLKIS